MKNPIKHLVIAGTFALATAMTGTLMAQGANAEHRERHLDRLAERLELTPEQKRDVAELHAEQHAKHKTLRDETRERMDQILNPQQREKMETIRQERAERMKQYHGKRGEYRHSN
jgi:periplasmic protein CpxP/Spy